MEKDSGKALQRLAVDGGMSNSELCMQTQCDLISIPVDRPKMRETTALGAAFAAGLAVGVWSDFDELKKINTVGYVMSLTDLMGFANNASSGTVFESKMPKDESKKMFERWEKAVYTCTGFV